MNSQLLLTACGVFVTILMLMLTLQIRYNIIPEKYVKVVIPVLLLIIFIIIIYILESELFRNAPPAIVNDSIIETNHPRGNLLSPITNISNKSNPSRPAGEQTDNADKIEVTKMPPPESSYVLTNDYTKDSLKPTCTPGSKQAACSSPDSCVDCNGVCWLPGSYFGDKAICAQGKWTIKDSDFEQKSSYVLTNDYTKDSLKPTCTPGSKQAACSSPDSCVDCNGVCWLPGSYPNGICLLGKWTIS